MLTKPLSVTGIYEGQLLLSKYGNKNDFEYIAESFVIYVEGYASQFYCIHPAVLKFYQSRDIDYGK